MEQKIGDLEIKHIREIEAIEQKVKEDKQKIEEVAAIPDKRERLQKLAELVNQCDSE